MSKKLPHSSENVCLTVDDDSVMYAVGSKANTDLLDARTLQVRKPELGSEHGLVSLYHYILLDEAYEHRHKPTKNVFNRILFMMQIKDTLS